MRKRKAKMALAKTEPKPKNNEVVTIREAQREIRRLKTEFWTDTMLAVADEYRDKGLNVSAYGIEDGPAFLVVHPGKSPVLGTKNGLAKIGIDAPSEIEILRDELLKAC